MWLVVLGFEIGVLVVYVGGLVKLVQVSIHWEYRVSLFE